MNLPLVNLTSDSDSSSSGNTYNVNNKSHNSRINASQTNSSHNQRSDFHNVQATHLHSIQSDTSKDPLFKIIFRDDLTSRKYRQRLEDIIKFVLMNEADESNQNQSSLVLDIFDPKLDKVSTVHAQPAQSFMQTTQQVHSKSTNYINQNARIDSPKTKQKLNKKAKKRLQQMLESGLQIPSNLSASIPILQAASQAITQPIPQVVAQALTQPIPQTVVQAITQPIPQAVPQAITQPVPQAVQQTQIDVSHIKQEKLDHAVSSNSERQTNDKNGLLNTEKPMVQANPSVTVIPTNSSIQEVVESATTSTVQIKQESPINSSDSEKRLKDGHKLQDINQLPQQIQPLTQISATSSPRFKQNISNTSINNSIHMQEDVKSNSSLLKPDLEKIQSSEKLSSNNLSQPQYTDIAHKTEIHLKPDFSGNDSNYDKNVKRKLASEEMDDYCNNKKIKTNNYDETDKNLSKEIYEVILDDSNYSQLEANLETSFENSTVKIGSYGYFNPDKSIFLSKDGFTFATPNISGRKPKILSIELDDILKILVHFSKTKPALFLFVTTKIAIEIRDMLNMIDPSGPYFDPNSLDLKHQRIAILPAQMSDETENILKELFKNKEMVEINAQIADDLANLAITTNNKVAKAAKLDVDKYNKEINDTTAKEPRPCVNTVNTNNKYGKTYFCRIIRVGSLEYAKKRAMLLSPSGLKFCITHLEKASQIVTIDIDIDSVIKVEIYFSKSAPVLFFYLTSKAAEKIRKKIGMTNKTGFYLDPNGNDSQNKIIILPQTLSEGCFPLKEWFTRNKIKKLDKETAKNILAKSYINSNKEKIHMTRSKTSSELGYTSGSMMDTIQRSESDEKIFSREDNAAKVKGKKNPDNPNTSNTAKINLDAEHSKAVKTNPEEECEETTEIISNSCIGIRAECVKVGTYKYTGSITSVIVSTQELNFDLPIINETTKHKMFVVIKIYEITEVWHFFSANICFLFLTVTSECAQRIRSMLGMHDKTRKAGYFDSDSESLSEKRIEIVFKQSNYKYRSILKNIFYNCKVNSLKSYKEARNLKRNKM